MIAYVMLYIMVSYAKEISGKARPTKFKVPTLMGGTGDGVRVQVCSRRHICYVSRSRFGATSQDVIYLLRLLLKTIKILCHIVWICSKRMDYYCCGNDTQIDRQTNRPTDPAKLKIAMSGLAYIATRKGPSTRAQALARSAT